MIITKDIRPEHQVYPIGAYILDKLIDIHEDTIEAFDLYELVKQSKSISPSMFFLGLDWLFLMNAIKEKNGVILKCF
jgi:hypothetical protein